MALLVSDSSDPYFNLATEEFFLRNKTLDEDIFILWQSDKAFVYGRNQNPFIEIKPSYFNKNIPIIRRISGGGTIFEDEGTINFSYITKDYENKINDYFYFLEPIINTLIKLGIKAKFVPKSHIFIEDKKISGNAQAFINNKLLHHGTLLFDSDLDLISDALVNYKTILDETYIMSNKQIVGNLVNFLTLNISIEELKSQIIETVVKERNIGRKTYVLNDDEINQIHELAENKYKTWEWNFGKVKKFNADILVSDNFVKITIDGGIITETDNLDYKILLGTKYLSKEYFRIIEHL